MRRFFSRLILPVAVTGIIAVATPAPSHTYAVSPTACWNTAVWQVVWIVKRVCRPDAPAPGPSAPAPPPAAAVPPPAGAPDPLPAEPAP